MELKQSGYFLARTLSYEVCIHSMDNGIPHTNCRFIMSQRMHAGLCLLLALSADSSSP